MSLIRNDQLEIRAPKPIDSRFQVNDVVDLVAIPVQYRYRGLTAFVVNAVQEYWLRDGIDDLDWIIKAGGGGGGGSTIQDDVYPNAGVITLPVQPNLKFGQAFSVSDDAGNNATFVEDTIFRSFVDDGLLTVDDIGGVPAGTPASSLKGQPITDILNNIFFPQVPPTYTPATLITTNGSNLNVERGEIININISSVFNQNEYGQGSNYQLTYGASTEEIDAGPFIGNGIPVGSQPYVLIKNQPSAAGVVTNAAAAINHDAAPPKNDNYGNPDPTPPGAGTLTNNWSYTTRYPIWVGAYTVGEVPEVAGVPVLTEALVKGGNFVFKELFTGPQEEFALTPNSGDNWMIAFCPPGTSVVFATDIANNIPFNSMISDFINEDVTDAQDAGGTEVSYNIHYYYSPAGFSGAQTVTIRVDD